MTKTLVAVAAATTALMASAAHAELVYGFETGGPTAPDGFGPNGGPVVTQSIGVGNTEGLAALSFTSTPGQTFVGALTGTVPAALSNPGNTLLSVDVTQLASVPSGSFASLVVVFFGATNTATPTYGNQVQLPDFIALEGRAPGTFTDSYTLEAFNPFTFATTPLFSGPNAIFGTRADQYTLTGFQFVINKSISITTNVLLDNVRTNVVPEPASLGLLGLGAAGLIRRRRA